MRKIKLITSVLMLMTIAACTTDDFDMGIVQNASSTQDTEEDETPQTAEPSEEPTTQPDTEEDSTALQNTAVAKHYYELTFSGGPMNGTTLSDSVAIGNGLGQYSDVEGPEVIPFLIHDGDVLIKGLLTRFNGADSFPIVDDDQIQEKTAAHLLFSFVPPGPSASVYASRSGSLEISDFELYKLQALNLVTFKIRFEGSFDYVAPPKEKETVKISGTITIRQHTFKLPDLNIPN